MILIQSCWKKCASLKLFHLNRRNTDSLKWNVAENELPMWVADMDFKTAPEITEAIKAKADIGVYGYTEISKDWYDAYTGWWERRHNFRMEDDWLMFVTGVTSRECCNHDTCIQHFL